MLREQILQYFEGISWIELSWKLALIIIATVFTYWLSKKVLFRVAHSLSKATASQWDDNFVRTKGFRKIAWFPPLGVFYALVHLLFNYDFSELKGIHLITTITIVILFTSVLISIITTTYNNAENRNKKNPLLSKNYLQFMKLIIYIVSIFIIASILFDTGKIIAGLGASMAIIILIFKDTILGFISGIQLSANNMLEVGDWIEMPDYGADGDVIEITLTTVKVQNWDNTIVCVPAYKLMNESFTNWRGMQESGGRRIKRFLYIDSRSIRFCSDEEIAKYATMHTLKDYMREKSSEITTYNQTMRSEKEDYSGQRALTNIGCFRAHLLHYLLNHEEIRNDMTLMVRQKQPNEFGLPIEMYCFTKTTEWVEYEQVQSDIFDHVYAVAKAFDLTIYQRL